MHLIAGLREIIAAFFCFEGVGAFRIMEKKGPSRGEDGGVYGKFAKRLKKGHAWESWDEVQELASTQESELGRASCPEIADRGDLVAGLQQSGGKPVEKLEEPGTMMAEDDRDLVPKCRGCGWDLSFYQDTGESFCTNCEEPEAEESEQAEDGAADVIVNVIHDSQSQAPAAPPSPPFAPADWVQPSEEEETQETEGYRRAQEESRRGTLPEEYANKVFSVSDEEEGDGCPVLSQEGLGSAGEDDDAEGEAEALEPLPGSEDEDQEVLDVAGAAD
jgi:uncharacterized Zn finger protein (UPF0148 family)